MILKHRSYFARTPIIVCSWLLAAQFAFGHIVPPEEYHPMTESYRRVIFMTNLNPVLWEEVRGDTDVIGEYLGQYDAEAGEIYLKAIHDVFSEVEAEVAVSLATPGMRKKASKALFELSTVAMADGIRWHIAEAQRTVLDYESAWDHIDAARQLFIAFEHEIKYADPTMYFRIGNAWLEASSALGSPGLLGVGEVPTDVEVFRSATGLIDRYIKSNYGAGYAVESDSWKEPVPLFSETYEPDSIIPVKLPPGHNLNKQLPRPRQILAMAERGVSESETTLIALGDMAFDSPFIFGDPATSLQISCNTCHNKGVTNPNFFIPGISSNGGGLDVSNSFFAPHANNGHFDPVDIPDLRGIRFTAPYGRNGRFASLREFTRNVIVNEFNGAEPDPIMLDALIAYMNEFEFLPNPALNGDGTLTDEAPAAAKRGEKLFTTPMVQLNDQSCASCHIPSNNFLDRRNHDIGSVEGGSEYSLDRTLDTPTLLSSAFTAPYMHDGSLATLRDVVDWFDNEFVLEYSESEKSDLTVYLETVGGGVDAHEDTMFTLDAEMEEFSFFLSSYTFLKQRSKPDLMAATFQTVALEIRAHKWDVRDAAYLPMLERMAGLMDDAYAAVLSGDSAIVDQKVEDYLELYETNVDHLK